MIILFYFLGASIGSFFCLVEGRINAKQSIVFPRSHCDKCQHILTPLDLIPSVSYPLLKGRCRYCHERYPSNSFQIEAYLGIAFSLLWVNFSWQFLFITLILSFCYLTDLREQTIYSILPVVLTICLIPFNLSNLVESIALIGGIGILGKITNGIGLGDLLIIFPIALYLGFYKTIQFIMLSCFLTLIFFCIVPRRKAIPFVPFLAWGFLLLETIITLAMKNIFY